MSALPDKTRDLTLLISGIDDWIILDRALSCIYPCEREERIKQVTRYIHNFWEETRRVLPKGGRIVIYASTLVPREGFAKVHSTKGGEGYVDVWEREF